MQQSRVGIRTQRNTLGAEYPQTKNRKQQKKYPNTMKHQKLAPDNTYITHINKTTLVFQSDCSYTFYYYEIKGSQVLYQSLPISLLTKRDLIKFLREDLIKFIKYYTNIKFKNNIRLNIMVKLAFAGFPIFLTHTPA